MQFSRCIEKPILNTLNETQLRFCCHGPKMEYTHAIISLPHCLFYYINGHHFMFATSHKKIAPSMSTQSINAFFTRINTANPSPVMRTGFSLCSISIREKPVFIAGFPANENRFFPVWKYYTGKTLFWPCTGPVRDCSALSENGTL